MGDPIRIATRFVNLAKKHSLRKAAEKVGIPPSAAHRQYDIIKLTPELRRAVSKGKLQPAEAIALNTPDGQANVILKLEKKMAMLRIVYAMLATLILAFSRERRIALWNTIEENRRETITIVLRSLAQLISRFLRELEPAKPKVVVTPQLLLHRIEKGVVRVDAADRFLELPDAEQAAAIQELPNKERRSLANHAGDAARKYQELQFKLTFELFPEPEPATPTTAATETVQAIQPAMEAEKALEAPAEPESTADIADIPSDDAATVGAALATLASYFEKGFSVGRFAAGFRVSQEEAQKRIVGALMVVKRSWNTSFGPRDLPANVALMWERIHNTNPTWESYRNKLHRKISEGPSPLDISQL